MKKDRTSIKKSDSRNLDDAPELILANDPKILNSFDPHICSVSIDAKTNNPTDGYKLATTLTFGSERVSLKMDSHTLIEVYFEIYKAELLLETVNCRFDMEFERDDEILQPLSPESESDSRDVERSWRLKLKTGNLFESVGLPSADIAHDRYGKQTRQHDSWYQVRILSNNLIRFESKGSNPAPLRGQILYGYIGWNVIPQVDRPSGILARSRVRSDWIKLVKPELVGRSPKWWPKFTDLFNSSDHTREYRREAFKVLLRHLVAMGLQESTNTRDATLAMDAVIVEPMDQELNKVRTLITSSGISLAGRKIAPFLESKPGIVSQLRCLVYCHPNRHPLYQLAVVR